MSDLCHRLRSRAAFATAERAEDLMREAADEITRLRKLLRATAQLAHAVADDESGIDENETYKAAIAAAQ